MTNKYTRVLPDYLADLQRTVEAAAIEVGLDFFPQIYELLDYKTMSEVAAYGGFPTRYPHWRFGMEYDKLTKSHSYGLSKIYELVINNDPCYAYLLEGNSMLEQKLVMAHVYAHNDFFKNNYYFSKTNRRMMDEMANHSTQVRRLQAKHGQSKVESFIDLCLSIDTLIDPMSMYITRTAAPSNEAPESNLDRAKLRVDASYMENYINPPALFTSPAERSSDSVEKLPQIPERPERDVMKFLINHAPLKDWEREILSIIREEAYYFAPQAMTKIMNEGWASYWHSKLMTEKLLDDSEIIDYASVNAGVMSGGMPFNPYKIGVELYRHIEDRWNKGQHGKEWQNCDDMVEKQRWDTKAGKGREKIFQVRKLYNDVNFIDEFFTEEFCREQLFYTYGWDKKSKDWEVQSRQYDQIKGTLMSMLTNAGNPMVDVIDGNYENRGEVLLRHRHEGQDLRKDWAYEALSSINRIWKRPANLETIIEEKTVILRVDGSSRAERKIEA